MKEDPSHQLTCKLKMQAKINHSVAQKHSTHLVKIHERYEERKKREELVKTRKMMTHIRPPSHSISLLLHELLTTPDIQLQTPTRGGVAFTVDSGHYRPNSKSPWKIKEVFAAPDEIEEEKEVS